jgi:hypothetical protein
MRPLCGGGAQVELVRRDYVGNGGWETFLTYEDPKQDILIGLLRLRKASKATFREEFKACPTSIVRELHVYGTVVPIHNRDPTKFQHQVPHAAHAPHAPTHTCAHLALPHELPPQSLLQKEQEPKVRLLLTASFRPHTWHMTRTHTH